MNAANRAVIHTAINRNHDIKRQFCIHCKKTTSDYVSVPFYNGKAHICADCQSTSPFLQPIETCMWDDNPAVSNSAGDYGQPIGPKCVRHSASK